MKKVIYVTRPRRQLSEEQLAAAFSTVTEDNPLWLAVNQLVDDAVFEATDEVAEPALTAEARAHAGGRIAASSELKGTMHNLRATGKRAPERGGRRGGGRGKAKS